MHKKHIHFMGINGSAISGVACLAKKMGYKVSGCDLKEVGDYTDQLHASGIKVIQGHSKEHLQHVDIVAVSPALLYKNELPEEAQIAKEQGKLMKWQEFLGELIFPQYQNIVCVCGTHGKTTTTSLLGTVFKVLGFDPTVIVGGIVPEWKSGVVLGKTDWAICEADEYDYNFMSYQPNVVILNNLEMEHPERFVDYDDYMKTFHGFFLTIKPGGTVIVNVDDENSMEFLRSEYSQLTSKNIKIIGFGCNLKMAARYSDILSNVYSYSIGDIPGEFEVGGNSYQLAVLGKHNISNAMAVLTLCKELKVDDSQLKEALKSFKGIKRRLEKVYDEKNIRIYNDYAHHHTQVRASLQALRDQYPDETIIAVVEPHQISRITNHSDDYFAALEIADHAFITKIYVGREAGKVLPDIKALLEKSSATVEYIGDYDLLAYEVVGLAKKDKTNILVMGAGNSYKIIKKIEDKLRQIEE